MKKHFTNNPLGKVLRQLTLLLALVFYAAPSFSFNDDQQQLLEKRLSITVQNVTMEEAIKAVETASKVTIYYVVDQDMLSKRVTVAATNEPLKKVLDELLGPYNIQYKAFDKEQVIVIKRFSSLTPTAATPDITLQEGMRTRPPTISGKITDAETKQPLPGVNILVKHTTTGASTNADGTYTIEAEPGSTLVFSFIGYASTEMIVGDRTVMDVELRQDIKSLGEVEINAGYWQVKESENTGSISRITSEVIAQQPVSNPLAAMIGRMPGVFIQQNTGVAGGAFNIQIRGQNSMRNAPNNSGNRPLYVVDGVPFTSAPLGFTSLNTLITSGGNPLSNINPSDIESIDVLKDADATAIYGSRGANGVVLITTKHGRTGGMKVSMTFSQGIEQVGHLMDVLNTEQYLTMRDEAFRNDNATPGAADYDVNGTWDRSRYTNWQKVLLGRNAPLTNGQLNFSGGTDNTQYFISGTYSDEGSVFASKFNNRKVAGHMSLNSKSANDKFKVGVMLNYVAGNNSLPQVDLTANAMNMAPNAPEPYDENGNLNFENNTFSNNPMTIIERDYTMASKNMIANTTLSYDILKSLTAKASIGYTTLNVDEVTLTPKNIFPASFGVTSGITWSGTQDVTTWLIEPQLEFKQKIWRGDLTMLAGGTFQDNRNSGMLIRGSGFSTDALMENLAAATAITISNVTDVQYRFASLFGRVNYNLNGKYLLNLTVRRDGSSRFGPNQKFANFGAVGAAWILSRERWFSSMPFISFAKLRSSIGTTGSDQISDYGYLSTYSITSALYQGSTGMVPTSLYNPDYAWERTTKFEGALELNFLQDRISFTSGFYRNRSSNQLIGYTLAPTTGFTTVQQNMPATVQNTGVEFELSTMNFSNPVLKWSTSFNMSIPRNKLIEFDDLARSSYANSYAIGEPLTIARTYVYTGVDPTTGAYGYQDQNNSNTISYPADGVFNYALTQNFYGGINNSFSAFGFQLDILFQFVKQIGNNYLVSRDITMPGTFSNQPTLVMQRWQKSGDDASVQQFSQRAGSPAGIAYNNALNYGDNHISDASFVRLKNVQLQWTVPPKWSSHLKMTKASLFVQGQNLLLFTKYPGNDPETQTLGVLPPLRVMTAGFTLNF